MPNLCCELSISERFTQWFCACYFSSSWKNQFFVLFHTEIAKIRNWYIPNMTSRFLSHCNHYILLENNLFFFSQDLIFGENPPFPSSENQTAIVITFALTLGNFLRLFLEVKFTDSHWVARGLLADTRYLVASSQSFRDFARSHNLLTTGSSVRV